jgi:hypothetical protein
VAHGALAQLAGVLRGSDVLHPLGPISHYNQMACYRTGLTNHRELGIGRQVTYYYALSNLRDGYEPSWRAIGEEPSQANEDETVIPAEQLEGIPDPVWDASLGRLVPRAEWRAAREEPEEALPTWVWVCPVSTDCLPLSHSTSSQFNSLVV